MISPLPVSSFVKPHLLDVIIYEDADPWLDTDEIKVAARTDRFNQKQSMAAQANVNNNLKIEAEPIKQALISHIAQTLPNMKGGNDRVTLEELIRIYGGNINPIIALKTKPQSLYMLASSVNQFMKSEQTKNPEATRAFLTTYGYNMMDWLSRFTPEIPKFA